MHRSRIPKPGWRTRIIAYGLILLVLRFTGVVEQMFYHPQTALAETPDVAGLDYEDVRFSSTDGTQLHGWFIKAEGAPKATVIHFHGNAVNIGNHFHFITGLPKYGIQVFVFDYRGYGQSKGRPSRKGIQNDAAAAIDYVRQRDDVDPHRIVLLAQSLGVTTMLGGWAQEKHPVAGMILDSGFTSYHDIARDTLNKTPVTALLRPLPPLLIRDGIDAKDVVGSHTGDIPLLIQHGEKDKVIPPGHAKALFERSPDTATLITYPNARHCEATFSHAMTYERDVTEFIFRCVDRDKPQARRADIAKPRPQAWDDACPSNERPERLRYRNPRPEAGVPVCRAFSPCCLFSHVTPRPAAWALLSRPVGPDSQAS